MTGRVRVWPLVAGLEGFNAAGVRIKLTPGLRGYVNAQDATRLEGEGKVQVMAGKDSNALLAPRRQGYSTAQAKAQAPADLDSVVDEDEQPPAPKKAAPRRKGPPQPKTVRKTYSRRDIEAET